MKRMHCPSRLVFPYVHRFPLKFSLMVIDGTTPFGAIILSAVMEGPAPIDG